MPSNHLILCHPLLLLPSILPSIRVFANESALRIRWPKVLVASASASVLPMNTQDWSPLGWTGWISLQFKGLSKSFPTPQFKSINSSALSFLHSPTLHTYTIYINSNSHPYMTTGKTVIMTRWTSVGKVMSLLFNMLSRLILSRDKRILVIHPERGKVLGFILFTSS